MVKNVVRTAVLACALAITPHTSRTTFALDFKDRKALLENLRRTNVSDLNTLLTLNRYHGPKPRVIYEGEGVVVTHFDNLGGIWTEDASSCSILIAIGRTLSGRIKMIGMVHIGRATEEDAIGDFYLRFYDAGSVRIETYVIGGVAENALKALKMSRAHGAYIKFFNADLDDTRIDAALVDRRGNVYYGDYLHLFPLSEISTSRSGTELISVIPGRHTRF